MKKHFYDQQADLMKSTSKREIIIYSIISIFLAFAYTKSFAQEQALTKQNLEKCSTIKVQYIKNELIETDSIDEYTLNLSKDDAIQKALSSSLAQKYEFSNYKNFCTISIDLGTRN
ncbi:MAG: hypothetical protein C0175_00515 [Caldisericum exile]|uniref:Uncharacterized protein n=1 Tax=Caldisericum exile TaxID=693075 RepID=A0A2J6X9M4_9BACT|nr:MAG: hypothetical protein C0175_00515 [Caldisericum exile]